MQTLRRRVRWSRERQVRDADIAYPATVSVVSRGRARVPTPYQQEGNRNSPAPDFLFPWVYGISFPPASIHVANIYN